MAKQKQTAADLYELCTDLVGEYGIRDSGLDELEDYYFLEREHDPDTKNEEEGIENVRLPYGTSAIDLVQDLLGGAELTVSVPALSEGKGDKELADTAEDFLLAAMHQSERGQRQDFMSRAAWLVGMRGALAGRVIAMQEWLTKDEESGEYSTKDKIPLVIQLRDPRYVYPSFGLDGLAYVVEQRTRKVQDLRNVYGDNLLPDANPTDEVEWCEYWDATRFCYWADGEPVKIGKGKGKPGPWPHLYGGIPYAFEFGRQTGKVEPEYRARPLLEGAKSIIDRLEISDSAEATFIKQYNGDSLIAYSDDEDFRISTKPGAINYMGPDERIEWLRASRRPLETQTADNKYNAHLERATFPSSMYGIDPGRVMAGYAINLLNQGGQVRIKPLIDCLERTLETLFENALMVAENYLANLVAGPISFYQFSEAEDEGGARYQARRKRKLDATKFKGFYRVNVSMSDLMPADEQANVVLAERSRAQGPDGRPLLSWETAVEKYKLTTSPTDERDRIDREIAWTDPAIAELRRAVLVAQIKAELMEELAELGINPDEILAQVQAKQQGPPSPEQPPAGLPPEMLPPQMQGQMMPQPMGGMMPGEQGPPMMPGEQGPPMPPGPPLPGMGF